MNAEQLEQFFLNATSEAIENLAKGYAEFISKVLIYFFTQTPAGLIILGLLVGLIAFKFWNWGIRATQKDIQKLIVKNQVDHYKQKEKMLREIQILNQQIYEIKQSNNSQE